MYFQGLGYMKFNDPTLNTRSVQFVEEGRGHQLDVIPQYS